MLAQGLGAVDLPWAPERLRCSVLQEMHATSARGEARAALKGVVQGRRQQQQGTAANGRQGPDAWLEVAQLRAALQASQQRCQEAENRARIAGQQVPGPEGSIHCSQLPQGHGFVHAEDTVLQEQLQSLTRVLDTSLLLRSHFKATQARLAGSKG